MNEPMRYATPEYPVLYSVGETPLEGGMIPVSLALLVGGIPSFLGTVPVEGPLLEGLVASLDAGSVRVVVEGIRIGQEEMDADGTGGESRGDLPEGASSASDDWRASIPAAPDLGEDTRKHAGEEGSSSSARHRALPAALLSLSCQDGRRVGIARIVSRDPKADPTSVARFVHRQITRGVQILDLAQAN
jgi:hypothetical protein